MTKKTRARLYIDCPLAKGGQASLSKDQAHYLRNVMRFELDELVTVFNGRDGEWLGRIAELGKRAGLVILQSQARKQQQEPDIWLLFAPIKKARNDFIVEKATELGVSSLWPVTTQRTQSGRINKDRMITQTVEAAEQCERLTLPEVHDGAVLQKALEDWPADRPLFILDETGDGQEPAKAFPKYAGKPAAILIGPEGGFDPNELEMIKAQPTAISISLGRRILRAETAVVAALSCWQSLCGDWR